MSKRENPTRRALAAGKLTIGAFQVLADPAASELMLLGGMDWVMIDAEHRGFSPETIEQVVRGVQVCGPDKGAFVRVPTLDRVPIQHSLEAGADGVVVPLVNSKEQAEEVAALTHYPPRGTRGLNAVTRAAGWGVKDPKQYVKDTDADVIVAVQIETTEALDALDDIAGVDGVDMLYVGPADLSHSLGVTAEFAHPKLREAMDRVFRVGREKGKWLGVLAPNTEFAEWSVERGVRFLTYLSDSRLLRGNVEAQLPALRALGAD